MCVCLLLCLPSAYVDGESSFTTAAFILHMYCRHHLAASLYFTYNDVEYIHFIFPLSKTLLYSLVLALIKAMWV